MPAQNNLNLYSINGQTFKASTSGKYYNEKAQASVLIQGIMEDTLKIKVEFENKLMSEELLYFLEKRKSIKNTEFNYSLEVKNNKINFIFQGTKQVIDPPNPLIPNEAITDSSFNYKNNVLKNDYEIKERGKTYFNNSPQTLESKILLETGCKTATQENEIQQFVTTISIYNSDSEKLMMLKKTYTNYCYSINAIKSILNIFIHDREKLDAAKLLYFYCVEKDNYMDISDVFSFNTTTGDLKKFVVTQKANK